MSRMLLLALALLSTAAASSAQGPYQWTRFAPEGGRFSVLVPAAPAPTLTKDEATSPQSGPYTTYLWTTRTGDELYLFGWVDYLPSYRYDVQDEIRANRDNFITGLKGRLISSEAWNFGPYPGNEFVAEVPGSPARQLHCRIAVIGPRPYMWAVFTPVTSDRAGNIYRFLGSFQALAAQ